MKKFIRIFYQKTIAVIVTISFLVTILIPANSFAFANVGSAVSPFIPSSLGKVTSSKFYDSNEIIINIQDLHCHAQTQRNIASILEYLSGKYNIDKIYLEGAYKNINTKWLSSLKNEQLGNKLLESLVDTGKLSGTEYYSVISNKNEIIAGMEDENLYKENIKLFGKIIDKRTEIEQIWLKLEKDINSIKKDYFEYNKEIRNFEKIITKFKNKKLTPNKYYSLLKNIALKNNISLKKYPNINSYMNLLDIHNNINKNKLPNELKQFLAELKTDISYEEYIKLLNESNNFKDITNISQQLLLFDKTYKITEKLKLKNVDKFLQYIEFNKNINPIEFIYEEENLIDTVFSKLATNKYEQEVLFLSYFLPKIKDYFLADITAKNYYNFDELFAKFKKVLLSYSSNEIVSELDKYQNLLSLYHKNNIKRDFIFAEKLIKEKNKNNLSIQNTSDALKYIENNLKDKKIKLVVTGGFHTAGLEKTLDNNKISYVIITPKVTSDIDKAKEIYTDTIKYNANILTNTINVEPLCQNFEVAIGEILNDIFYLIKNDDTFSKLKKEDIITFLNNNLTDDVKILDLDYSSTDNEEIKYTVTYSQNGKEKNIDDVYFSVKNKDEKIIKKNNSDEAVIFKNLFKSLGEKAELIYKTILAPIAENFVFFWVPFLASSSIANISPDLAAIPFAVTSICGIFAFPLAHKIADYFKGDKIRSFKKLLIPSALFTSIYIGTSLAFPGHSFIAFIASSVAHSIYNILVLKGIINLPLAFIGKFFGKNVTIEEVDKIVDNETLPRHQKIDALEKKLFKAYPSNKEVSGYIIEELYEMGYLNNKEIPYLLQRLFKNYEDIKFYFLTILGYDKRSNINIRKNRAAKLENISIPLTNFVFDITNNSPYKSKKIEYYVDELDSLKNNISEDTLPVIKWLIRDIVNEIYNLSKDKNYEYVIFLLNTILPLYEQIVSFYGKSDDATLRIIKDIAVNNIEKADLVDTIFNFIFEVYKIDKQNVTYFNNGIDRPVIKLLLEILNNLNENNIAQTKYLEKFNDINDIKNIFENYVFDYGKINDFLFNAIIKNSNLFSSEEITEFCKKLSPQVLNTLIQKMYFFVIDDKNSFDNRKIVAERLGKITAVFSDKYGIDINYIDIDKINSLYDKNKIEYKIYLDELYDDRDRENVNSYFYFSPLLQKIYNNKYPIKKKIVYTDFIGITQYDNSDTKEILNQLKNEEELKKYNDIALDKLNSLSNDIRKGQISDEEIKDRFYDICDDVEEMIKNFEMIDNDGSDFSDVVESFNRIKLDFLPQEIDEHFKVGVWEENRLYDINSLHSLINAVHQVSAIKFINNISDINFSNPEYIQKISSYCGDISVNAYNLSDNKINGDILELFDALLQGNDTSLKDFIIYNDKLHWTCRLRVHSVSVYFDFKNKIINLSFTESANVVGNRLRLAYFNMVLERMGFNVTGGLSSDILTLKASISKDTGINVNTDFVNLAKYVVLLFRHSDELDLHFNYLAHMYSTQFDADKKIALLNNFVKTFFRGFMWFNYEDKSHEDFKTNAPVSLYLSNSERERFQQLNFEVTKLNNELINLGLEPIPGFPKELFEKGLITQQDIDEYINIPLEKAFAEGRIIVDKQTGMFVANPNCNLSNGIINHVEINEIDSIQQSEVLNFIDTNKFNFNTLSNIGGLILKSGYIKISSDKFLSVTVLTESNGNDFKYAYSELVTLSGERETLDYKQLNKILTEYNFNIPKTIENISVSEQQNRKKLFDKNINYFDTPSIFADGVSSGNGKWTVATLNYNRDNTNKSAIWVTPYTTTEDMEQIENSAAVITTTGGRISHASIVTNELGIPSINISNGIWKDGKLYAENFLGEQIELKEGLTALVNGKTGQILIFDGIDNKTLNKLQQYIDEQDPDKLIDFIKENENNKNLNKLLEYMFFNLSGELTFFVTNSQEISNKARVKLESLTNINLKQIEQQIENTISNIRNTDNLVVKYMLVKELDKEIENINNIDAGLIDKYTVYKQQVLAAVNKFVDEQLNIVKEMAVLAETTTDDTQKVKVLIFLKTIETLIPYLKTKQNDDKLKQLQTEISNLKEIIYGLSQNKAITKVKSSNEEIKIEDFIKYGAKFINTVITSNFLEEENYQNIKVPPAYGISEDVLKLLFNEENRKKYEELNNNLNETVKTGNIKKAEQISKEIIKLINDNLSNKNILEKEIKNFDNEILYAVRSSGVGEDEGQSFAGMGKTDLNIKKENIVDAVIDSWKSFYQPNSIRYAVNNRNISERIKPCIMIQPFIAGEISGIVFSRNRESNSVISVGYGLGEGIVNNTVPFDNIETNIINKGNEIKYQNVNKTEKIVPKNNGGTIKEKVEENISNKHALSDNQIKSLMKAIKFLENKYGYPIDVEFTIKDEQIYILQVRPITILNEVENNIEGENVYGYFNIASIFDGLFKNTKTNLYKYWTLIIVPAIETLLFIAIPFVLFATNPFGFWAVSVIGFALSHLVADVIINKTINPLAEIRSLSDIMKLAGVGIAFSSIFIAINMLLPGYPIIAFALTSIAHSIYNYFSVKNDKLSTATIIDKKTDSFSHITYPIANEESFNMEEIYKQIGIEQFVKEIELWNKDIDDLGVSGIKFGFIGKLEKFIDRLYLDDKLEDAAAVIKVAYKLGLVTDVTKITNLAKAGYEGSKFFYDSTGVKNKNVDLENAVILTLSKLNEIDEKNPLYDDVVQIKEKLQNDLIDKGINETTILVVDNLFRYYPGKINNSIKKGRMTIEQADVLFEAVVPLYQELLNQNIKFNKKIFDGFKNFALLVHSFDGNFYSNKNSTFFKVVNLLCELTKTDSIIGNNNKHVVEIAKNIKSKDDTNDILKKLQDVSPEYYISVSDTIFEDIGLNKITLNLLLESLKETETKDYKLKLPLNIKEDIDDLFIVNELVKYSETLDMGFICHYVYFEFEKDKTQSTFANEMIKELTNILKDEQLSSKKRKAAAVALGKIYSIMYEYIDTENIVSIDELNDFYKDNNMDCLLIKNGAYIQNFSNDINHSNYTYSHVNSLHTINNKDDKLSDSRLVDSGIAGSNFTYTNLILKQGLDSIDNSEYKLKEHAPSFIVTDFADKENKIADSFDALNELLKYNSLALDSLDNVNSVEQAAPVINYLEKMIDCFEIINKEHAQKSRTALNNIKTNINRKDLFIQEQKILKDNWNEDYLDKIDTLHTLINAVHQTSFKDLTYVVKQQENLKQAGLIEAKYKGTEITAYNFSNNKKINPEVKNLMHLLSLDKHNVELFVKDGTVIWTKRLLAHSVDIVINFDEPDRGIKIYYNDSGVTIDNKWRIDYLSKVLTEFGFYIETNFDNETAEVYKIKANLDNNSGLNNEINLSDIATSVVKLFEYSINLDITLRNSLSINSDENKIQAFLEGYAELFMNGEIASNYDETVSNLIYSKPTPNEDIPSTAEIVKVRNYLNDFLKYLGLQEILNVDKFIKWNGKFKILDGKQYYFIDGKIKRYNYMLKRTDEQLEYGEQGRNFFQKDIEEYFNKPIEQAYIEGKIMFDSEGKLIKNENYNLTDSFVKMFEEQNEDTLINVAEIIKAVPEYNKNYYSTEFAFGGLIARTSEIKLNNESVYIRELFDPLTNSIEYAQAELVTMSGRNILTDKDLKEILEYEGYEINNIWVSSIEKANRKNKLKENMLQKPEQLIDANITSEGKNKHLIGEVVFDEELDNINENKILFKKFTTPKDFSVIKKSGGVITTAGGSLSHAAITTKELGKPSLILNETEWKTETKTDEQGNEYLQKYLEVTYYKPTGETEIKDINGIDTEIQKMQKETVEIRQGDKILMSTENGFIVKLSDENLEAQVSEIDKYSNKLKQKIKDTWKQEIIKELEIITGIASKQVAEILLFDVRNKITDTTLILTNQDMAQIEKEMEQTKNKIYEDIHEQYYSNYYEETVEKETDKFIKEKDIVSLDNIETNQKNMFGGKTVELAKIIKELKSIGIGEMVPLGFGLSKNVPEQYCGEKLKELNSKLKELINENKKYKKEQNEKELENNEKEINKVANEIKNIIEKSSSEEIEKYILENINENKYYAIRSSGIGEDGIEYAFAGMGESILNVKGNKNVIKAIKDVWKSFYDEEAIEYMLNTGQFIQPAVLVEEMVKDPDAAGVVFSRNENYNLIINATKGLGDKVVDGTVTPDAIEVNALTGETIEYKSESDRILTSEQIKQLNETVMFLEDKAGYPIDVEFAFKDNKLYILQRRADTKFSISKQIKQKIHPNIKFDKINNDVKELFFVEYANNALPVYVSFDEKTKQITFVIDEKYQDFNSDEILNEIVNRVNNDIVVRAKVNRNLPIFNNIIAGQLEFLPPVPIDNLKVDRNDIDDFKNSRNTINILSAA